MLAGFAGVGLLVTPGAAGGHFDRKFILGAILVQIGSIGWQYGTHRAKYTIRNVPFVTSTALQMLFGGVVSGIAGVAVGETSRFSLNARTLTRARLPRAHRLGGGVQRVCLRREASADDEDVALRVRESGRCRRARLADPA